MVKTTVGHFRSTLNSVVKTWRRSENREVTVIKLHLIFIECSNPGYADGQEQRGTHK